MDDSVPVGGPGGGRGRRLTSSAAKVVAAVVLAVVAAGAGTAYAVGRGHHRHKAHGARGAPNTVQVATAASGVAVSELSLSGTVSSAQSITVVPGVAGQVASVAVAVGQAVQAGQVLMRVANPVLEAQLTEAQAAVATAQAKVAAAAAGPSPQAVAVAQAEVAKAQVALQAAEQAPGGGSQAGSSSGGSSQAAAAVGEAQAALALAQAQAAQAEAPPAASTLAPLQAAVTQASDAEAVVDAQVAQEAVTAPFAGTVASLSAVVGEQVTPTSTLLSLDGAGISVQAPVAEQDLGLVRSGETASISQPDGSASVPASVSEVAPAANPSSLTFSVTLTPDASATWLAPGEAVTASVVTSRTPGAVLVPSSAVVSINGHPQVFVVHAGHTVGLVDVTPGISDGTTTAVTGLGAGSEVVTLGQTYLAPGDRVRVTERVSPPATVAGSSIGGLLTAPVASPTTGAKGGRTAGASGTAAGAGAGASSGTSTGGGGGRGGGKKG